MDSDWWKAYFDRDFLAFHKDRPYQNTEEELSLLDSILGPPRGRRLLDACCGPGRHAIPLSRKGWRVVGLDFSRNLLETARSVLGSVEDTASQPPRWVRGDLSRAPFRAAFDVALSMWTSIGYCDTDDEHRLLLQSVYDCLKPEGTFVLDLANRDCLIQHPGTLRNWWKARRRIRSRKDRLRPDHQYGDYHQRSDRRRERTEERVPRSPLQSPRNRDVPSRDRVLDREGVRRLRRQASGGLEPKNGPRGAEIAVYFNIVPRINGVSQSGDTILISGPSCFFAPVSWGAKGDAVCFPGVR